MPAQLLFSGAETAQGGLPRRFRPVRRDRGAVGSAGADGAEDAVQGRALREGVHVVVRPQDGEVLGRGARRRREECWEGAALLGLGLRQLRRRLQRGDGGEVAEAAAGGGQGGAPLYAAAGRARSGRSPKIAS